MKKSAFITIIVVGMTTISGCVTAQKLTSNVDPNSVTYSAAAAKNVNDIYMGYSECLSDAFVQTSEQKLRNGDLPDMQAKIYEDECIREEQDLYQAFYSASRDHDPNGPEAYAHATANKGVEHVKKITFDSIAEGFQPPR